MEPAAAGTSGSPEVGNLPHRALSVIAAQSRAVSFLVSLALLPLECLSLELGDGQPRAELPALPVQGAEG